MTYRRVARRRPGQGRFRRLVAERLEPRRMLTAGADWEFFDRTIAPDLPSGWTESASTGTPWATVNDPATSASGDRHAFVNNEAATSDKSLISSPIYAPVGDAQLSFRNHYQTQASFDGGVLEISIAGGPFTDIFDAGGTFVSGGYNAALSASANPLAGRDAWSGDSGGYVDTLIDLPSSSFGEPVEFR